MDGKVIRLFLEDGRKKCSYNPEEPIDNIEYCSQTSQFVGWVSGEDEIFVSLTYELLLFFKCKLAN